MFRSKKRTAAAWAKGLMLGKAVGARDERDRIIDLLLSEEGKYWLERWYLIGDESDLIGLIRKGHIKEFIERYERDYFD